jgi:hypothetical protein
MIWIPAMAACLLAGCATTPAGAPTLSVEAVETIDAVAEVAIPLGSSLALLWPPAAVIGGILAGVGGAWKKMKPKLADARSDLDFAEAAGEATAYAIEEFKKAHPEEWSDLSTALREHHGPEIENYFRALRGLPPKG